MPNATLSSDMDAFLVTANDAAARQELGLGTVATLASDTDGTLAANSDTRVATQKALKTYVDGIVTGLLDFKGSTDCSGNPNYPAASKGDSYVVSVAGKIGGASGSSVAIGDVYFATADNAGGTQAGVGTSWTVLEHNIPDLATVATTGSASDLSTGTLPNGRFPATLPAADGSNLTALNATQLLSGSIPAARIPAGLITDTLAALAGKPTCGMVSTTNLTKSGEQTIDGQLSSTSYVLLTGQTAPAENGPWITAAGAWSRPTWYPNGGTAQAFQFITITVRLGTTYGGSTWRITTAGAITIDTTGTTWTVITYKLNASTATGNVFNGAIFGVIGDRVNAITTGVKALYRCHFGITLANYTVIANASGSIVLGFKRTTSVTSPSGTDIIGGGNAPTLAAAQGATAALSGWTSVAIAAGDVIELTVVSVSGGLTQCFFSLDGTKT